MKHWSETRCSKGCGSLLSDNVKEQLGLHLWTQESLDEIEKITGKMEIRRQKMRKEEEERADKIRKDLEEVVRRQKEGLEEEGTKIWGGLKAPSVFSPSPSPCMTPLDPSVTNNRFGTVSPTPVRNRRYMSYF